MQLIQFSDQTYGTDKLRSTILVLKMDLSRAITLNCFSCVSGTGSYGNGAAMRVHPAALHCYDGDRESLVGVAKGQALVTHAHKEGWQGAVVQAHAVYLALHVKEIFNERDSSCVDIRFLSGRV